MQSNTVIDIASCTKVVAAITGFLIAHSRGLLDFDAPFAELLPEYRGRAPGITVRQLANHLSGFHHAEGESPRCYFAESGMEILRNVLRLSPPFPPQEFPHYACWNYILLAKVLEHVTGEPFDRFCEREIFAPLGMTSSSFGTPRREIPENRLAQTIGTAHAGELSDAVSLRIFRDGGTTGNAGMFSSAEDLAKVLRCYLRRGETAEGGRLFGEAEMAEIAPDRARKVSGERRFGWIVWDECMRDSEFGTCILHLGWSGQTVFLDLKRERFGLVLTTRFGDYGRAKRNRFDVLHALMPES